MKIIQFLSPWQGRHGFQRFVYCDQTHRLQQNKTVKPSKVLNRTLRNIEGLLLRPTWPGRSALLLVQNEDGVFLQKVKGDMVDHPADRLDVSDPTFSMRVRERGLYRTFIFACDDRQFVFRDMAGRLIGPQRVASEVFPQDDFSPFARLVSILDNSQSRATLLSDLERSRFKYRRWTSDRFFPEATIAA